MTKSIRGVERLGRLINTSLHEVGAEGFDAPAFRECTPQGTALTHCAQCGPSYRQPHSTTLLSTFVYAKTYDFGDGVYKATHQAVALFLDAL